MLRTMLLLSLIILFSLTVSAQTSIDRPLITVSGQAEIKVVPDQVIFNLEAVSLDKNIEIAKNMNDETVQKVPSIARKYQIPSQDVQTDYLGIQPMYTNEDDDKKESVFLGYSMSKRILITLKDVSKTESLLSDVIKAGVNRVHGISFHSSQIRKYKEQARAMAIKAAQEKAIALTKEIGQKIGKAYSISEERPGGSALSNSVGYMNTTGNFNDEESTIALGVITVSVRVEVSFILE